MEPIFLISVQTLDWLHSELICIIITTMMESIGHLTQCIALNAIRRFSIVWNTIWKTKPMWNYIILHLQRRNNCAICDSIIITMATLLSRQCMTMGIQLISLWIIRPLWISNNALITMCLSRHFVSILCFWISRRG